MQISNIHNAKTNLSQLIEAVVNGEEVIIAKAGKPVAKLVPYSTVKGKRKPGNLKIKIADDFDETSDEILNMFYGSDDENPS